jgi:hypothetical protein
MEGICEGEGKEELKKFRQLVRWANWQLGKDANSK